MGHVQEEAAPFLEVWGSGPHVQHACLKAGSPPVGCLPGKAPNMNPSFERTQMAARKIYIITSVV